MMIFQALEHNTPRELLTNKESTFYKMVQSTGSMNAEYLRSLVLGDDKSRLSKEHTMLSADHKRWQASSCWAAGAEFGLDVHLSSSQK